MSEGVSVHTVGGERIGDLTPAEYSALTWSRERSEVSRCEITMPACHEIVDDLRPWLHWVTVWDCGEAVWTGPVQKVTDDETTIVEARDVSTLMWRTRCPLTRNYVETDPARIALPLWESMLDLHRVKATPLVMPTVLSSFDFSIVADSRMLNSVMDDLVKLGLDWTVSAGVPVLGPLSLDPLAELSECDFLVRVARVRDGVNTANDVRLQGTNFAATARVRLGGLHLQTLVSLDDVYGVSNVTKAANEYARRVASIGDSLVVPAGASLHPDAPVTLRDLVPGAHFVVHARDTAALMRLESMSVTESAGAYEIGVTLESEVEQTELEQVGAVDLS